MPSPATRLLAPSLNAPGLTALIAALYALGAGIWHVAHHQGAMDPAVIVAALTAFSAWITRQYVTPVADPRDGNGKPLATSALPVDPTMAELAGWFHDRGVEVKLGTAPATDAIGSFLPDAPPAATGRPVPVTPGQEYQARAFASSGSPLAVRAVDVMASPQSSPPSEGN